MPLHSGVSHESRGANLLALYEVVVILGHDLLQVLAICDWVENAPVLAREPLRDGPLGIITQGVRENHDVVPDGHFLHECKVILSKPSLPISQKHDGFLTHGCRAICNAVPNALQGLSHRDLEIRPALLPDLPIGPSLYCRSVLLRDWHQIAAVDCAGIVVEEDDVDKVLPRKCVQDLLRGSLGHLVPPVLHHASRDVDYNDDVLRPSSPGGVPIPVPRIVRVLCRRPRARVLLGPLRVAACRLVREVQVPHAREVVVALLRGDSLVMA
mmetsp:Transcript_26472/g.70255  ORF Transcript_26472/g.70255 Transcript_26472/m.70255 type:complete len:269 (-) Transcript_26472:14-820(-)